MKSKVFSASVLEESTPMTFLGPFGFKSGRDFDKLSKVSFRAGITGCPLITEHALSVLEAEVIDLVDLGTHTVFIGNVVSSEILT
ncbi:MAG: flavin reductase [Desulfobacterales bacterium]|nr:MAG: flavin reductase [Desulfobacterales bacterium]